MTPLLVLVVALAGGVGSAVRFMTDEAVPRRWRQRFPWGTVIVNLTGSFVLGVVLGAATTWLAEPWVTMTAVGFLGGFTTFSAASVETVQLLRQRRITTALLHSMAPLTGCVALATLGLLLGS